MVEHERDARQRDLRGDSALDGERELPRRLSRCLRSELAAAARRTVVASEAARRAPGPPCSDRLGALTRRRRDPSRRAHDGCAHRCRPRARRRRGPLPRRRGRARDRGTRGPREAAAAARGRAGRASAARPPATRMVWRSSVTPSAVSSASTVASASCRGSICAPGIGSAGGSTTTVTRAPRRARSDRGAPASGKRSASRTAAATSTAYEGGGGRRTTSSSSIGTWTIREPESRGTRRIPGVNHPPARRLAGAAA